MDLLIVRHARAQDRDKFAATGKDDSQRPLTQEGIRRMQRALPGLRALVPTIDLLVSSPLRRAVQTAQIIAEAYRPIERIERDELAPGVDATRLLAWLNAHAMTTKTWCIVGHEPDMSNLLAGLVRNKSTAPRSLKKGSAALVHFDGPIKPSCGTLRWYHTAKELRKTHVNPRDGDA